MQNSSSKHLYQLITNSMICEQRLQPYKLTSDQISQVFKWLDVRRRGSIDVSDFYKKFIQLTQCQLFYIFKYLDVQRNGSINIRNMENVLVSKNKKYSTFESHETTSIQNFINFIKILKAIFYLIQDYKKKYNINKQYLQHLFYQCNKNNKIYITDLKQLFQKDGFTVDQKFNLYIKNKIFYSQQHVNFKQFYQIFLPIVLDDQPKLSKQISDKIIIQQSKLISSPALKNKSLDNKYRGTDKSASQIDKILQKYRNPNKNLQIYHPKQHSSLTTPTLQKFIPNKYQQYDLTHINNINNIKQKSNYSIDIGNQINKQKIHNFNNINKQNFKIDHNVNYQLQYNSANKQISKRRQQLKKGSIERQKIIDNILNKNKQHPHQISPSHPNNLHLQNPRYLIDQQQIKSKVGNYINRQPTLTPTVSSKVFYNTPDYQSIIQYGRIYQPFLGKQQLLRPASAAKASNPYYDRQLYGKLTGYQRSTKPQMNQFYRKRVEMPIKDNNIYEKQNIIKRAQEQATKKIQQIERRARLKVMQKRSAAGVYNRWLK